MLNSDALILRADIAFVVRKVTCEQALHLGGDIMKSTRAHVLTRLASLAVCSQATGKVTSRGYGAISFLSKRNNFTDVKEVVLKFNIEIQIHENARLT